MRNEQQANGTYRDVAPERNIRADAIKETFAAQGVALTTSGRYVDTNRVQHAAPAARIV